ncbi:MAG: hypothetical protein BMS9Abin18_0626 [Zetaproteobacteria bacterium]|nr:MAG: hypothetical protein BMS9Abin18_0626 [Zetaproteobacteria bacterium]
MNMSAFRHIKRVFFHKIVSEDVFLSRSAELWCLLAISILAVLLRFLILGENTRIIPTDGVAYIEIAKGIANNYSFYHPMFPPGYSIWIVLFHDVAGLGWAEAGQWASFIFSILLMFPLYAIFKHCVSVQGALLGLLFYACLPLWAKVGTETQTMSEAGFFFFLSIWLCMYFMKKGGLHVLLVAGFSLGLAALSRPELLVAAFILPGWLIYRSKNPKLFIKPWLLLLAAGVVYSPYVVMLHDHTGDWRVSMKTEITQRNALAVGVNDFNGARELLLQSDSKQFSTGLLGFWVAHPVATIKRMAVNIYLMHEYMWPQLFSPLLTFFLALGLLMARSNNRDVLWIVTLIYLPTMTFLLDARILLLWATPFLAWAGLGAWQLVRKGRGIGAVVVFLAVVLLAGSATHSMRQNDENIAARKAGEWLYAEFHMSPTQVWSRKPWVAFYAGMKYRHLPSGGLDDIVTSMQQGDWLVVDSSHFATSRPRAFAQLFQDVPPRIKLVHQFPGPDGYLLNLYRASSGKG